jgi:hypothetical protein
MKRYVEIERNQAPIIQNKYSCAWCWSSLRVCHDKEGDYITCGTEDCKCDSLITTRYAKKMVEDSEVRARTARAFLEKSCEWLKLPEKKKLSEKESLEMLGF